ncbi:MAG: gephyrin-like molybdotransferase Glp, partial [Vicinamibacterales bacterium]
MRPFGSIISLDEAQKQLAAAIRPIERTERVPLTEAAGRVAATDVVAALFVPPFARSAMDGFAVVATDTAGATREHPIGLRVVERIYTGQVPRTTVEPGTCSEIATGAPMPHGADAVVMVEETRVQTGRVEILAAAAPGQNVGRRGADISPGDLVARRGDLLTPSRIGALAAVGTTDVEVFARPRVAVLSTGNEVVEPGTALSGSQIYDVNRFTLSALISNNGGEPQAYKPAMDTLDGLRQSLDDCSGDDLFVFSGGSSVGDRDLVVDLIAERGQMIFHGIAIKPGKPTAFARIGDTPFFGMPGNPTSCLSNAYVLLIPFVRAMARLPAHAPRTVQARIGRRIVSPANRHQIYTVRLEGSAAYPAFKGSGDITSLSQADGYIEIPADRSTVEEGE